MVTQELITTIKRLGIESGVIEVFYASTDPVIMIGFFDEEFGEDFIFERIQLGRLCHIKEAYVIGDINMDKIKSSEVAEKAVKLLLEQGEEMKEDLIQKARQYAKELTERAGIPVDVTDEIQGEPGVMSVHGQNMWHSGEVFMGYDDDY